MNAEITEQVQDALSTAQDRCYAASTHHVYESQQNLQRALNHLIVAVGLLAGGER